MTAPAAALPIGRLGRLRRAHVRRGWRRLRRRVPLVRLLAGGTLVVMALAAATAERPAAMFTRPAASAPAALRPVDVPSPLRLAEVVVHAPRAIVPKKLPRMVPKVVARALARPEGTKWTVGMGIAPAGEPIAVEMTAYCLKGTTRRGRYVRPGIIAADPRVFPLAKYVELYIGKKYMGRFLVDDTGRLIKGTRIDVWTPTCREAILFGRRRGTAILVPRGADAAPTPNVDRLSMYTKR